MKFPKGSLFGVQFCFVCLDDQFDCLAVGLALQNAARINSNLIGCGNRSRFASIAMRCFSLTLKSAENSNNIIQKALAFLRNRSSTAFNSERKMRLGILPRRLYGRGGASVVPAMDAAQSNRRFRCQRQN